MADEKKEKGENLGVDGSGHQIANHVGKDRIWFPEIESSKIILRLDRVILRMTQSLLGKGRLGVFVPSPDQTDLKKKRERTRLEVCTEAVSPYTGKDEELREKAHRIKAADVDLVVLDCIGFSKRTKSIFREITGKPVLLPRTIIARIAREMVEV